MKRSLAFFAFAAMTGAAMAQSFTEGFDSVGGGTSNGQNGGATLEGMGWFFQNNSNPRGSTDWFQGNPANFVAHSPGGSDPDASYMSANFNNVGALGSTNTISNWALLPSTTLRNGDLLSFWTRTVTGTTFPDRLEVRMSTNGASTNVGTSATDVGDFTTLLLTINPNLTTTGYPTTWTQFNVTVSGLSGPTSGRLGFRYHVTNMAANGNLIGIDTLSYTSVPEPATLAVLGIGAAALLRRRRK